MQLRPLCTPSIAVNPRRNSGEARPIRCKRWSCPVCKEINRRKVMAKAVEGQPTAMLTLTVSSKNYATPEKAARDLKRGLVALRKRIRRSFPDQKLPFLAVFEKHKSGWPHLHLLIRAKFLPVKRLRQMWEGITGSFMVDIRRIGKSAMAALYVAKYLGKDLSSFEGCKRWWRSHDYKDAAETTEAVEHEKKNWGRYDHNIKALASTLTFLGAEVRWQSGETLTWHSPPDRPITLRDAIDLGRTWWPEQNV